MVRCPGTLHFEHASAVYEGALGDEGCRRLHVGGLIALVYIAIRISARLGRRPVAAYVSELWTAFAARSEA